MCKTFFKKCVCKACSEFEVEVAMNKGEKPDIPERPQRKRKLDNEEKEAPTKRRKTEKKVTSEYFF